MSITTYLFRCRRENAVLLFWLLVNSFCLWANGILSAQALTNLVALDFKAFFLRCSAIVLIYLLWSLQIKQQYLWRERAIQAMDTELRKDLALRISYGDSQDFAKETVATYSSWLTNDVATINDLGFEVLEYMVMQGLNVLIGVATLIGFHPSFALTLLVFAGLMQLVPKPFQARLQEKAAQFSQKNEELLEQIKDVLSGFQVLLSAGRLTILPQKIGQSSEAFGQSKVAYAKTFGNFMACQNLVSMASQIAILTQAGWLFSHSLVPVGVVTSAQYFASTIFASLTGFLANASELKSCQPIFDKFHQLPSAAPSPSPLTYDQTLSLQEMSFTYGKQALLTDVSLTLNKSQTYVLSAPSGTGKSTLLRLLAGEVPLQEGELLVDGRALQPVRARQLATILTYLPQSAYLFKASLAFNLTLGQAVDDERLAELLQVMGLDDWITNLPNGLDTVLDDQNQPSGGQVQKLCLIRALLLDRPILLLDESLSAVDQISRRRIEDYLFSLDKTILYTSHQLDSLPMDQAYQLISL